MPPIPPTVLFGGPSLSPAARTRCQEIGIELRPPVRRQAVYQLLDEGFRGTLVVVDGVFQQVVAVGHRELIAAHEAGCRVVGMSSMGAIRAYELRHFGMEGFGAVYDYFRREADFQDDEVALLHDPAPPYRAWSEPLVHLRVCADALVDRQALTAAAAGRIIDELKALYFGERTLDRFASLVRQAAGRDFRELVPDMAPFRIKQRDVEAFLTHHYL